MCGISGIISNDSELKESFLDKAKTDLFHRGPDHFGTYKKNNLLFCHNRLSIIDVTSNSDQPSVVDGDSALVFNGEIYNYKFIAEKFSLNNAMPSGAISDTRVLHELLCHSRFAHIDVLDGMYAFAFYEESSRIVSLSCDIFGAKNIYYASFPGLFVFASEYLFVQQFLGSCGLSLNPSPLSLEACYSYLAPPIGMTLVSEIKRLPPGGTLRICENKISVTEQPSYETPIKLSRKSLSLPPSSFFSSVQSSFASDVPCSVALSGGIDSSFIVKALSSSSFSSDWMAYFVDQGNSLVDEGFVADSAYADQASLFYGIPKLDVLVSGLTYQSLVDLSDLVTCPGDLSAAFPLDAICRLMTRHGRKVLLGGLGADELFWGYRYHKFVLFSRVFRWLIYPLARTVRFVLNFMFVAKFLSSAQLRRLDFIASHFGEPCLSSCLASLSWGSSSIELDDLMIREYGLLGVSDEVSVVDTLYFGHFLAANHLAVSDAVSMASSVELRPVFLTRIVASFSKISPEIISLFFQKFRLKLPLLFDLGFSFVSRPKTGFGASSTSLPDNDVRLILDYVLNSPLPTQALKDRIASDFELFSVPLLLRSRPRRAHVKVEYSRKLYGLISLFHSLRLLSKS